MPQQAWSDKREQQYQDIKQSQLDSGKNESLAEEIASRTVNKQRARAGESETASKESLKDVSAPHRGGKRSGSGPGGRTRDQLYAEAQRKGVDGRSKMNKDELRRAVDK